MKNMKLKMATLAIGSVLTLLAPVTAAARDRNELHAGYSDDRGRTEQRWNNQDRSRFTNVNEYREGSRFHRDRGREDRYQERFDGDRR